VCFAFEKVVNFHKTVLCGFHRTFVNLSAYLLHFMWD